MKKTLLTAAAASLIATASFGADLIVKTSPHSVSITMGKLVAAVKGAGAGIVGRVNHAAAAKKIGMDIAPNEVLIFGNPKLGSPVFVENPAAGLDLPMRVVVYEDKDGSVKLAYHPPARLSTDHQIPADLKPLAMMTGALGKLTDAAIAE